MNIKIDGALGRKLEHKKRLETAKPDSIAIKRPDLMGEWDWNRNETLGLDPYQLTCGSNKKAWWVCRKHNHSWFAVIQSRTGGAGCPYCHNRLILPGFNDLETTHKSLLEEWDYENNDKLPTQVMGGSHYKAAWVCSECGNSYRATVADRAGRGRGCPECGKNARSRAKATPKPGNSLADKFPDIAGQWHPTKNGDSLPSDYKPYSNKKVWWLCECGHAWQATINNRTSKGRGCPQCASYRKTSFPEKAVFYYVSKVFDDALSCVTVDFNGSSVSLDIWIPSISTAIEYDGQHWHQDAEKESKKNNICFDNGVRLIRVSEPGCIRYNDVMSTIRIERRDATSSESLDEAVAAVMDILGCGESVDINSARDDSEIRLLIVSDRRSNSFGENYPELVKEWHPTRNGGLTPYMFSRHSGVKAWFVCENNHEYQAIIADRANGKGCYTCAMKALGRKKMVPKPGESFGEKYPYAASAWHPTKNGDMTPYDVAPNSNKRFWWKCQECGHEWEGTVQKRTKSGKPLCRSCSLKDTGKSRRMPAIEFETLVTENNPNTEVVGEYDGYKTTVACKCRVCGHTWDAWPQNLIKGHGCNICAGVQRKKTRAENQRTRETAA